MHQIKEEMVRAIQKYFPLGYLFDFHLRPSHVQCLLLSALANGLITIIQRKHPPHRGHLKSKLLQKQ